MSGPGFSRKYLVGATVLSVRSEPGASADLDALLESAAVGHDAPVRYTVEVRTGEVEPVEGELVFEGSVPEDGFCIMRQTGETMQLEFPGTQSLVMMPARRHAEIVVAPSAGPVAWTVWMMVLEAALDAGGEVLLHAAGLCVPGSRSAILLYAPSGTGKTTASLALAGAGFGLMSDDGVVVGKDEAGWRAWGMPRAVKIHRQTARMLSFLDPALGPRWDVNGEQAVALDALAGLLPVEAAAPRRIAAVIQLARASGPESVIGPASRVDILASLAADNVRIGRTGLLPQFRRKLEMLTRLSASVPVLRLETGADLSTLGELVQRTLADRQAGFEASP